MDYQQQTLLPEQGSKPLTVYRGGSHASRTALQESVKRLLMSVICGQSSGESFAKLNPDGLWLKMCQGYCQVMMDGSLEMYSGTLPKWGLMLRGVLTEPVMSAHRTGGSASGLWPTVKAVEAEVGGKVGKNDTFFTTENGTLRRKTQTGSDFGMDLTMAVRHWPTPRATDPNHLTGLPPSRVNDMGKDQLGERIYRQDPQNPGSLNPDWVETLMGFPLSWTDLDGPPDTDSSSTTGNRPEQPKESSEGQTESSV